MSHEEGKPVGAVVVVGAGIAGMQASLDLAEMGFKVYLVEEKPAIGGVVPQLDKTFPTNDCAMCILAPKLVETGRHPNIEILINAQVEAVTGTPGNFAVTIRRRATCVDPSRCNGCGECETSCPVVLKSEHDEGLAPRRAIYRRYPQAIPNAFAIDKRGVSPCRTACPAGINIHGYVALIRAGKYAEAYRLITAALPFPGICGRACHHPCELACNRKDLDQAISIRNLKRFVADQLAAGGPLPALVPAPPEKRPERIAIIGAGPAGLTVAKELLGRGFPVKIFDAAPVPGGMMALGIPSYRLPRSLVQGEVGRVLELGAELELGVRVDAARLAELLAGEFVAAVIAIGAHRGHKIPLPGAEHPDCLEAISFLRRINLGEAVTVGRRVVVVGGGNVAMDVARSARRLGAREVHLVCLEARRQMPAHKWEQEEALEEGVIFHTSRGPKRVVVEEGRVAGLETLACNAVFDATGAFKPSLAPGTEEILAAETVILAVGQGLDTQAFEGLVARDGRGRIQVDPITFQSSQPNIFAAGDVVTGPASVVGAVGQGRAVAESISRLFSGQDLAAGRAPVDIETARIRADYRLRRPRIEPAVAAASDRVQDWREIERAFTEEEARAEADRCLNCGGCSECLQCVATCKRQAVNHGDTDRLIAVQAGAVLLSPGFEKWHPEEKRAYAYGRSPNILTSPEFERILSASGPYGGHLIRPSDHREPKRIAFLQCMGSRDPSIGCTYCSSVCCMYAVKEAVIAKEHSREPLECHVFFMDMRAFGKGFEKYYQRAAGEYGVRFRRQRVPSLTPLENGDVEVRVLGEDGRVHTEAFDMVVLAVGMRPAKTMPEVSRITGAALGKEGFLATRPFAKEQTEQPGIFAAGAATEPMDIPETVARASAAAGAVAELLAGARGSLVSRKEFPPDLDVADQDARIGVFVCACGINIGGVVNVQEVAAYARRFPGVVHAEHNLYTCSQDTQEIIKAKIEEHRLNRVLVASCTPRTHESLFQNTIHEKGLNPFLFEFVSLREQVSWVHPGNREIATNKAKSLLAMGLARVRTLRPVVKQSFPVQPVGLVVGGGVTGLTAALSLADQGYGVHLVERTTTLGGQARHIRTTIDGQDVQAHLASLVERVGQHPRITLHLGKTLARLSGYIGNYQALLAGAEEPIAVGAVIVASGGREITTDAYGYGRLPGVISQRQLEEALAAGEARKMKGLVMIQCAGSRSASHPYCSRICCTQAVKNALAVKAANPKAQVTVLYRDIRTYGFREQYYQEARRAGVLFVRFADDRPPQVRQEGKGLVVEVEDALLAEPLTIPADRVVLSLGIAAGDNAALSQVLKAPLDADGFFLEAHAKLRPLEFATDGIFLAGLAHSPKDLTESISQARGAAAKAATLLGKEAIQAKGRPVAVTPKACSGCGLCVRACPYEARFVDEETGRAQVIEVLCQGCGACAAVCPNSATQHIGFESGQILAQIDAALG
ncbi:MAG: FAD-dependent oxidoreductase [Thermodesulfobacteriota bacterium]